MSLTGDDQVVRSSYSSPHIALWVITVTLLASVAVLGSLVYHEHHPLRIDDQATTVFHEPLVSRVLESLHLSPEGPPSRAVHVGRSVLLVAGGLLYVGVVGLSWKAGDRWGAALCLVGPLVALVLTEEVLKPLIGRQKGDGLAFPSGHSTVAAAIAGSAVVVALRCRGWRSAVLCAPVAALLPVGMGLAVVRLGYHYPTDVAGGTAFGLAVVFGLAAALPVQRRRPLLRREVPV